MNFSEEMFYENYLTLDFHTNSVISRRVCLLVKMASKTVIRPIKISVCLLTDYNKGQILTRNVHIECLLGILSQKKSILQLL